MGDLITREKMQKESERVNLEKEKNRFELYLQRSYDEKKKLENELKSFYNTGYDNSGYEIAISALEERKAKLSKHPIINIRKIKEIDNKISELKNKNIRGRKLFNSNRSSEQFKLEEELRNCNDSIIEYENELKNVEMEIKQIDNDVQNLNCIEGYFDNNYISNTNLDNDERGPNIDNSKSNVHLK